MAGGAAAVPGLPPLSFSTGPAVSGGNPATGGATDGAFTVNLGGASPAQTIAGEIPLILFGGLALWIVLRRK